LLGTEAREQPGDQCGGERIEGDSAGIGHSALDQ
jgi:hypothetical protein